MDTNEETWELLEEAEDGSWQMYRLDDPGYSLWATADTDGFWQVGHVTWSREDGTEEHEDHEGTADRLTDEGPDVGLEAAQAQALAKLVEIRGWADEYERQMMECEANEAISEEEMARLQDEEDQVRGEVN